MKTWLSWSSGKDSAWALEVLSRQGEHDVEGLVTTVNGENGRVAMHGVRRELLDLQFAAAGLPATVVELPWPCSNEIYEARFGEALTAARDAGIEAIAFGDLFLEDVRAYRERQLEGTGLMPLFPLWGRDTSKLADEMVAGGLESVVTCVDTRQLDARFSGRNFDAELLSDLPESADPCGERGEFHSFVCAGPMFAEPIEVERGERHETDGFVFTDLLPVSP